jgi:hypothetical protein
LIIFAVENVALEHTMNISTGTKINQLLAQTSPSGLMFSEWMSKQGYSAQLQKRYRDTGWLSTLCKGVMYRTGSQFDALDALASYNYQMGKKLRVGAVSALEYAGFNHYVPMGKPVLMVALPEGEKVPQWMKAEAYDMNFRTFSTTVFSALEVTTRNTDSGTLYVSSPEQAFLESLVLAPKQYSYMDLYYIMEQLATLRPEVVQGLMEGISNHRVKRMFLYMAEKAGHYWFNELDTSKIDLGTGKLQLVKDGVFNSKYAITVPKELNDYEG